MNFFDKITGALDASKSQEELKRQKVKSVSKRKTVQPQNQQLTGSHKNLTGSQLADSLGRQQSPQQSSTQFGQIVAGLVSTPIENDTEVVQTSKETVIQELKNQITSQQTSLVAQQQKQQIKHQVASQLASQVQVQIEPTQQKSDEKEITPEIEEADLSDEIKEAIEEASEVIVEDFPEVDPSKVEIKSRTTKDGYYKTTVKLKKEGIPEIISQVATDIKGKSSGAIAPRVCDMRVIANTNKTQLKNSNFKLQPLTVVFKPTKKADFKAKKYQRIMLSIPEDFGPNNKMTLYIYIQESRQKAIIPFSFYDFPDNEKAIIFLSSVIRNYYHVNFEVTANRIQIGRVEDSEQAVLLETLKLVSKTGKYKVRPVSVKEKDARGTINYYGCTGFDVKSSTGEQQHLMLNFSLTSNETIEITLYDSVYKNVELAKDTIRNINSLKDLILPTLEKYFNKDWNPEIAARMGVSNQVLTYYNFDAGLTHSKLKKFIDKVFEIKFGKELSDSSLDLRPDIELLKAYNKKELKAQKILGDDVDDYDAEVVTGKTEKVGLFTLSYLAPLIEGGDKRNGSDYITSAEYRQKYGVNSDSKYQQRKRTIHSKEGKTRNYHARKYTLQLEYKSSGMLGSKTERVFPKTVSEVLTILGIN